MYLYALTFQLQYFCSKSGLWKLKSPIFLLLLYLSSPPVRRFSFKAIFRVPKNCFKRGVSVSFFILATLSQLCSSLVVQCHYSSHLTLYIVDAVIPPYSKSKPGHHPTLLADDGVTGAEANKSKVARLAKVSNILEWPWLAQ